MSSVVLQELGQVLGKIDRPGSFCVSGSAPAVLPGLEVKGLGPVGLPLSAAQAKELKKLCEQASYGKGEETLVDTSVRRVWQMKPERFSLTNPDWDQFLSQTVKKVQEELGLEDQKLESHLYDLLLYEKGSFFLPHRDGEKLARMVATLVIVLPSSFEGGELVVRHEGAERTIDFGGGDLFRNHFAAFYADCEHEVRPLRKGHRLCLVYNLTLKKGKKGISAPRFSGHIEQIGRILGEWAEDDAAGKLGVLLQHQYTKDGLAWDALKGVDRAVASALLEASGRAGCQAYLALLTLHESGSAEGGDYGGYGRYGRYGRRRRWEEEEEPGNYKMGEVYETSLTAEQWSDRYGSRLPIDSIGVKEDELVGAEALREVDPEEEFEGYTGNAGMTLDRWYRHGAIFLWPDRKHFAVLCGAGSHNASAALKQMVDRWKKAGKKDTASKAQCVEFAGSIIAKWRERPYGGRAYGEDEGPSPLLQSIVALDEPALVKAYLAGAMTKDASVDPGKSLTKLFAKHGWGEFEPELEAVFQGTTNQTLERDVRLLEEICLARPGKKSGWLELCKALALKALQALDRIDQEKAEHDYRAGRPERAKALTGLARSLLATEQFELLSQLVSYALARPEKYPLTDSHVAALTALGPWIEKNVKGTCPPLSQWIASCCDQLEALTAQAPEPPADFRREAAISCTCADCAELKRFLADPEEEVYRFRAGESRRAHLERNSHHVDVSRKTERKGSPHTLVCTKNTASYQAKVRTFQQNQADLATLRSIEAGLAR